MLETGYYWLWRKKRPVHNAPQWSIGHFDPNRKYQWRVDGVTYEETILLERFVVFSPKLEPPQGEGSDNQSPGGG